MGILSAPFRGLAWICDEVRQRADDELYNEDPVRDELTEIYRQLEDGSLAEEEFNRREAELVQKLEDIAERKRKEGGSDD